MSSHVKWLMQAAKEIRDEGHAGWGNTCEDAANYVADLETTVEKLKGELADCSEYLKDRETPAQCIARNRADLVAMLGYLADEKKKAEALETKLAAAEEWNKEMVRISATKERPAYDEQQRRIMALEERLAAAEAWIQWVRDYGTEVAEEVDAAINHPGSKGRDSTEGVG